MTTAVDIAQIAAVVVFLIGLFQWIETRRREVASARYEQFHRAFALVAGQTAEGHRLVNVQQAMGVYELGNFPEYRAVSLPIIEYYLSLAANEADTSLFRRSLRETHAKLSLK